MRKSVPPVQTNCNIQKIKYFIFMRIHIYLSIQTFYTEYIFELSPFEYYDLFFIKLLGL